MKNVISNTFTITAQKPTVSVDHIDNFYIVEATGTQPAVDDSRWQFVEAGDPTPKTTPAAPYLWHKTITWLTDGTHLDPVVEFAGSMGQNGNDSIVLDIDNEMDSIPADSTGKTLAAVVLTTNYRLYKGSTNITAQGTAPTVANIKIAGVTPVLTTNSEYVEVKWTIPAGTTLGAEKYIASIPVSYGGNTYRASFTANVVKSGQPGVSPSIYQLLLSCTEVSFARNSSNVLTPSSVNVRCGYTKTTGATIDKHVGDKLADLQSIDSKYNILYRPIQSNGNAGAWAWMKDLSSANFYLNIPSSTTHVAYEFVLTTAASASAVADSNIVDRETLPINKDGLNGAGGDEGNGIDTVTLARMFTTNFVQPSNTDSGWINEGYSNYPTEAGLSDVNHYLWQRKKTTYTKSSNVTYEVVLFAQFIDGVHENLLDDTAFLSEGEMEAWGDKNGTIGQKTIGNHNSFGGTPVWENQYTELLKQTVYKYGTVQKLKPNTWYTLSFYGAMTSYQDLLSSSVYNGSDGGGYWQIGASLKSFWLEAGQSALITVTGRCYSTSVFLKVFGFRDDWGGGMTKSIDFTSTSSVTKSFKLTNTGTSAALFRVCGYVYLTDGSETQNSYSDINHRAYITLIRLDRGCKLNTYLYRSDNGQAVQHSASAPWYVDGKKFTSRGSLQDSNTGHVVTVNGVQENVHDGTVVNFTDDGSVLWQMSAGTLRHSVTFKTPSSLSSSAEYRVLFRLAQYSHYCWISMPKLEEGTAATDWIESSNDRKAEDIQHVFVGNWVASTQGDKSTYYFFGGGTGVRHVVRARKSASGAYTYWRMKQRTTSEGYYSTAQPYNDTTHWEQADYLKFIAAEFALIDEAIIKFTQTNRILVYNSEGTVAAGMGGAPGGSNDFPLWVGASYENRANAAFRVTLTGKMYATGCVISGDSQFEGTLKGVSGSFLSLDCIDYDGVKNGGIDFFSGYMRFSGECTFSNNATFNGDIYHQGGGIFFAGNTYNRGFFASRQRYVVIVMGTYAYYFPKEYVASWDVSKAVYVNLATLTSGGRTYYRVDCYSPNGYNALAGMPVDTVLFRISGNTTYYYVIDLEPSQRVFVANINDEQNNVVICCNGRDVGWKGGEISYIQNMGYGRILPNKANNVFGAGQLVGPFRDSDWR